MIWKNVILTPCMFYRDLRQHSVIKILKLSPTLCVIDRILIHIKHLINIIHLYPKKLPTKLCKVTFGFSIYFMYTPVLYFMYTTASCLLLGPPGSNWCFSFAPELVGYSAPRDLHRRAAYSICESWFLIHQDVYHDLFVCS